MLTQKFGRSGFVIVGEGTGAIGNPSANELPANGREPFTRVAVWIYPKSDSEDEAQVAEIARIADEIVLVPGAGAEVAKRRPRLVESFRKFGLAPDYDSDLTDLDSAAVQLTRRQVEHADASIPAVETAFARLNQRIQGLERTLRTRMSELDAADRHIARLEEKVLSLKEAKRALKQLKQEKQALRKSPERKIGQVLLAPYRLPQKLYREVSKRVQRPATPAPRQGANSAHEYQAWFERHRAQPQQLETMRAEAATFSHSPLISILTPVFNTPVAWLEAAVASVLAQAYERWELVLIDDASTDEATVAALARLTNRDQRIRLTRRDQNGGISAASNRRSGRRLRRVDRFARSR